MQRIPLLLICLSPFLSSFEVWSEVCLRMDVLTFFFFFSYMRKKMSACETTPAYLCATWHGTRILTYSHFLKLLSSTEDISKSLSVWRACSGCSTIIHIPFSSCLVSTKSWGDYFVLDSFRWLFSRLRMLLLNRLHIMVSLVLLSRKQLPAAVND